MHETDSSEDIAVKEKSFDCLKVKRKVLFPSPPPSGSVITDK